ncbi:hypothetical protein P4S95_01710 [Aneurinibacillus aneurinilyticus]|uniref:hypothetical protein n=1 Tax=Aneurinibacillus aneurinilyticus TaxID=1391 RepID=UPI002E22D2CF|nr:hypothetical protein [Aneurinibacillus aneurinilyticus]
MCENRQQWNPGAAVASWTTVDSAMASRTAVASWTTVDSAMASRAAVAFWTTMDSAMAFRTARISRLAKPSCSIATKLYKEHPITCKS